jgi:hypothetical protein
LKAISKGLALEMSADETGDLIGTAGTKIWIGNIWIVRPIMIIIFDEQNLSFGLERQTAVINMNIKHSRK